MQFILLKEFMQQFAAPTVMKKISLALGLASLVFCAACGTSGIRGLIGTGHYSNASLNGSYVYQITGWDLNSGSAIPYQEAGVFTANGSGTITAGVDDAAETGAAPILANPTTGSYSIQSDGTGVITLSGTGFGTINLNVSMVSTSKAYLIEADGTNLTGIALNATGVAEKQSSTTLPASATAFVFKQHSLSASQDYDSVGQFILAANGSLTGSDDVNRNGTINNGGGTGSALTLTASSQFTAPDTNGRGQATFADSTGTTNFEYYIVDTGNIRFLAIDSGVAGSGRAEAQTGTFTSDPLSGKSFAFGSKGDDNSGTGAVNTVGSITASSGAITGALDSVQDATSYANAAISSGSYTAFSANGRSVVTLVTGISSNVQQAFWMVNPTRAFFLTTNDVSDPSKIEDGTADQQQGTFTNSSLNGQYAFTMDGYDLNLSPGFASFVDRVGWIQWSGSGSLTWNEQVNTNGQGSSGSGGLSGTYAVAGNGRTTASVSNLSYNSNDIVFYLVSGSDAYILENDPGVQINGVMSLQQ
ncbi:MAG TPA: hypothetical protein VK641_15270 [Terriglobales bacterium]|nr:hypothetical protein [Terriglobales bacterium]